MNFQWSSLLSFFYSLIHFTGFKCSLESCPGGLMTPDRHIVFKAQFKTPGVAAQAGSSLSEALDQLWKFRKEGVGKAYPANRQRPTHTCSQPQV